MSSTATICSLVSGLSAVTSLSPLRNQALGQVLHEEHRPQDHVRRKAELLDRLLDAELVLEVRDAGLPVGRADRRVDEVLHALVARDLREALALLLLLLDARLPGVLHREHAPGARDRALERRGVVEIAGDHLGAQRRQRLGGVAVRLARHRAQLEAALLRAGGEASRPPCLPVAPVIRTTFSFAIGSLLFRFRFVFRAGAQASTRRPASKRNQRGTSSSAAAQTVSAMTSRSKIACGIRRSTHAPEQRARDDRRRQRQIEQQRAPIDEAVTSRRSEA